MGKSKNESPAGILLNTFGTILLLTVIIICTLNFIRDGRGYQMLANKASANVNDAAGSNKTEPKDNSDSSKNGTNTSAGSNPSSKLATDKKTAGKPANKTTGADAKNTGEDNKKPVQPGEEP